VFEEDDHDVDNKMLAEERRKSDFEKKTIAIVGSMAAVYFLVIIFSQ